MEFKNEEDLNIDDFTQIKEDDFAAAGLAAEDTEIMIPMVPENCQQDTKDAIQDLEDFVGELGEALAYENYLQSLLQVCCDEIENGINEIRADIDTETVACATETFAVISDLFDIEGADE